MSKYVTAQLHMTVVDGQPVFTLEDVDTKASEWDNLADQVRVEINLVGTGDKCVAVHDVVREEAKFVRDEAPLTSIDEAFNAGVRALAQQLGVYFDDWPTVDREAT